MGKFYFGYGKIYEDGHSLRQEGLALSVISFTGKNENQSSLAAEELITAVMFIEHLL